jgi:peptidoglycan/LPS O-acetylase OafA/YrhL
VILFFVLSGYLITRILRSQIDRSGSLDYRGFYARRVARLLPAVTLVAVISPLLLWAMGDPRLGWMPMAELLTFGYMQDIARGLGLVNPLEHTWSLAVEEHFYLLWPVTVAWLLRHHPRRAPAVIVGAAVALTGWHLVAAVAVSGERTYFAFDTNACFLAAGCALALRRQPAQVPRLLGPVTGTVLLIEACAAGVAYTPMADSRWVMRNLLTVAIGAAAVGLVACAPAIPVLRSRVLRWFGRISYSLYLWHVVFLTLLPRGTALSLGWRVAAVAAAIGVSAASWRFIEAPILRRSAARSAAEA